MTLISQAGVPDDVWAEVTSVSDEKETVRLLMAIAAINLWIRMNVTVHTELPPEPPMPS